MAYTNNILVQSVLDKYSNTRDRVIKFYSNEVSISVDSIETRVRVEDVEELLKRGSSFGLIKPDELISFEEIVAEFIGAALLSGVDKVTIPRGMVDYIAVLMYYRGERWCINKLKKVVK